MAKKKSQSAAKRSKKKTRSDASIESPDDILRKKLRVLGLKEKAMTGDGNCQFRSLADQLWVLLHDG
jgi:hypothetical protein